MCVAAAAWNAHPDWRLVVAGNRDEYHARPAAALERWADVPGLIAGRDLSGGGTWLGIHDAGRFALVTNFRQPEGPKPGRPSRGGLVTDLLEGRTPQHLAEMNPFNVIHCDGPDAWFLTNFPSVHQEPLASGIHGLSNGGFHDRWPKTLQLESALRSWLVQETSDLTPLLDALRVETPPPSTATASGGPEPRFAPVFISDALYGTRCSTVVAVKRDGSGTIAERRFDEEGIATGETRLDFRWPAT
ncbi:NRDE family protein [Novosphingobium sp. M1R2S20]|uniref:NRDE family protein n=1 Tax=Novosphingobium rhizovicinum TaxID=3228928 RepID=A0ABV3RDW1_9SPHN